MKKIVVTSDLHVHPFRVASREAGADRLRDGVEALRQTLEAARKRRAGWLFCGDLKEPKTYWPQDALNGALQVIREYDDVQKLMIPGNHDVVDGAWGSGLSPFRDEAIVVEEPSDLTFCGVRLALWPYGGDRMDEFAPFARDYGDRGAIDALVAHVFLRDALLGPSDARLPGKGASLRDYCVPSVFDRMIVGDIHKAQVLGASVTGSLKWHPLATLTALGVKKSTIPWRALYPGSPYQQRADEAGDWPKGCVLLDFGVSNVSIEFIPVDAPRFEVADLTGDDDQVAALERLAKRDLAGAMLRVIADAAALGSARGQRAIESLRGATRGVAVVPRRARPAPVMGADVSAASRPADLVKAYVAARPLEGVDASVLRYAGRQILDDAGADGVTALARGGECVFESLTLSNFLAYRATATVPLDRRGVVLIRGDVRVSSAADSNGAGKTTIASALAWALWGETLDGKKGDDVICRFAKGPCTVAVTCRDGDRRWRATRTRRPGTLSVEESPDGVKWVEPEDLRGKDAKDVQDWITSRVGYGFRTFRNAVVFDRFERFASADTSEQMRMLDEIQGIDYRAALRRATDWRAAVSAIAAEAEANASAAGGRLEEVNEQIEDAEREQRVHDAQAATIAEQRDDALAAERATAKRVRARIAECESAAEESGRVSALVEERNALVREVTNADAKHRAAEAVHDAATESAPGADARDCPTCGQKIDGATARRIARDLGRKRDDVNHAEVALKKVGRDLLDWEKRHGTARDLERAFADARAKVAELPRLTAQLEAIEERVEKLRKASREQEPWPGVVRLRKLRDRAGQLERDAGVAMKVAEEARRSLAIADYWVVGFGDRGIRTMLLDQLAPFLQEREQRHLEALTAGEASAAVSAFTALKKGTSRDKLSHSVAWSWGAADGRGSEGQDKRADLALFAALQDVAETWAARPFALWVLDEPGDGLDARGQELFVQWVRGEAARRGTVLLITHSQALVALADPDETWTVVHDEGGAYLHIDNGEGSPWQSLQTNTGGSSAATEGGGRGGGETPRRSGPTPRSSRRTSGTRRRRSRAA